MKTINVGVIGTGWCGGIRAEACRASPFAATQKVVQSESVRQRLSTGGALVSISKSPEEFSAYLKSESERWGVLIRERKITAE